MTDAEKISMLRDALERLRKNAARIFDKVPVRDWAETLAEADRALKETSETHHRNTTRQQRSGGGGLHGTR